MSAIDLRKELGTKLSELTNNMRDNELDLDSAMDKFSMLSILHKMFKGFDMTYKSALPDEIYNFFHKCSLAYERSFVDHVDILCEVEWQMIDPFKYYYKAVMLGEWATVWKKLIDIERGDVKLSSDTVHLTVADLEAEL